MRTITRRRLGRDSAFGYLVGWGAPASGITVEEGCCLLKIERMEVAWTKPAATGECQLKEIRGGPADCGIVQPEPSRPFEQTRIRSTQEIFRGA